MRVVARRSLYAEMPDGPCIPLPALTTTTGPDGTFRIAGERVQGHVTLTFEKRGYVTLLWQPLPADASPRTYVVPRACSLEGSLLLPDGVPMRGFAIDVYARGDRDARAARELAPVRADGSFRVEDLAPGFVDVEVLVTGRGHRSISARR